MKYEINHQKINEGMEEYMKYQVNLLAVFTNAIVSNTERLLSEERLSEKEKIMLINENKDHLDKDLSAFTSIPSEPYHQIIPLKINNKYLPEIRNIIGEGKKSLDSLIVGEKE